MAGLSKKAVQQLNDLAAVLSFKPTWAFSEFLRMPQQVIALFCGNQAMKTSNIIYQYVLRVWGRHPIPKKNVMYFECESRTNDNPTPHGWYARRVDGLILPAWEKGTWNIRNVPADGKCPYCGGKIVIHQRQARKIRLCSETLPGDKESASKDGTQSAETKNTIYPELKKWMPPFLIKRDITFRNPAMIIKDPNIGYQINGTINKGDDIIFDFMSYQQSIQSGAGVQRMSIFVDEEPPKDFYDEQLPRLLAEDGDLLMGLTPAHALSWTFDEIFEKSALYVRTKRVCDFLNHDEKGKHYKQFEKTSSDRSIGVLQAATDDNPTLNKQAIEVLFAAVDDPDVLATRRYGIHRQVSGRIFKDFEFKVHFIDWDKYFPNGMFTDWNHYRMIDYHPHNKWACVWMSVSPWNEAFVWKEWAPDPEKIITWTIAGEMAMVSGQYKYKCDLIDPRAAETQTNTGTTTVDDLNSAFRAFKKDGVCTGAYWETWDTKGTRGREVVRERLKYAKECVVPFNNKRVIEGVTRYVPTLWISNQCPQTAQSLRQWRLDSWARSANNVNKDRKEVPMQKFSHFCTALEAIFKDQRCRPALISYNSEPEKLAPRYFQGRRAYR